MARLPLNRGGAIRFYSNVVKILVAFLLLGLLGGCIDNDADDPPPPPEPQPQYDFSAVDARLQELLDTPDEYDGLSYVVVDKDQGVIYQTAKGDHTPDLVVMLAALSKIPQAATVMALHSDTSLTFDIDTPIVNYVTWTGRYGDRTMAHLLSNTSGIPNAPTAFDNCIIDANDMLERCASVLYDKPFSDVVPPATRVEDAVVPVHLSGGVAQQVVNSDWRQAFDNYIAAPCGLEVMQFGNIYGGTDWNGWNGSPDSLKGFTNPLMHGGAISNVDDMAEFLLMLLRDGQCGATQVMSAEAIAAMRVDRTVGLDKSKWAWGPNGGSGLGWLIGVSAVDGATSYFQWGAFGSSTWLDFDRGVAAFLAIDDYPPPAEASVKFQQSWLWSSELGAMTRQAVDEARAAVGQ